MRRAAIGDGQNVICHLRRRTPKSENETRGATVNRVIIFVLLIAAVAVIGATLVWAGFANDSLDDLHTWFRHFSGPARPQ
jgi:hypothetical protein